MRLQWRLFCAAGLLGLLNALAGCGGGVSKWEDPIEIVVPEKSVYWLSDLGGRLEIPVRLKHSFSKPALLRVVSKDCGCLDVRLPEGPVAPGAFVQLTAVLPALAGAGSHTFVLSVDGLDQEPLEREIKLGYRVYKDCEVFPDRLVREWRKVDDSTFPIRLIYYHPRQDEFAKSRVVVSKLPDELELVSITGKDARPLAEGAFASEWEVVLKQKAPTDQPKQLINTFEIGIQGRTLLPIRCEWVTSRRVICAPQDHYFGAVPVGESAVRRCLLTVRDGALPKIKKIESTNPAFQVRELHPESELGTTHLLEVLFLPRTDGSQHGVISLQTDAADAPEFKIEVSGLGEPR